MTGFPLDPPESALPPLGPAISPRTPPRPSPFGEMTEPLAPFGAWPAPERSEAAAPDANEDLPPLAPAPSELEAIDSGSGVVDDLPWLTLEEIDEGEEDEEVEEYERIDSFGEVRQSEPEAAEEGAEPPAPWEVPGNFVASEGASSEEPLASAGGAAGGEPAEAAAVAVAARLEAIARTLREHGPAGLLVGQGHDPLYLLIAGYALGRVAAEGDRGGR